ncbi:MAG: GHKL domain-containing protein [Alphaproteobacteria bacterium]|nr:GHKL domain-containing protein [Alphaproteobacteria bacterium]
MNISFALRKFLFFLRRSYKRETLTYLFFFLSIVSCVCTYCLFYNIELFNENPRRVISILYFDLAFIVIFLFLAWNKITFIWSNRHKKSSRFTLKLISIFSFISILPSVLMCIFTSLFFHNGLESWFNKRNQTALRDSLNVANSYLEETHKSALRDCVSISRAIEVQLNKMNIPGSLESADISERNLEFLNSDRFMRNLGFLLDDLCNLKDMSGAILVTGENIIAHSKYSVSLHFLNLKYEDLQQLQEVADLQRNGKLLKISGVDEKTIICAACFRPMESPNKYMYLITEKKINPQIIEHADNARKAFEDYYSLLKNRNSLERAFTVMFFVIGLLILVISILLSLIYSWKFIKCISNLIDVSETVMEGDFTARVDEPKSDKGEISDLTKTFNQMISKVHRQQNELIAINDELDEKVKFITNVLSGISSGVIGLDNLCVYIWNSKAEDLLGKKFVFGENILNILPELQDMIKEINEQNSFISKEINYQRDNKTLLFSIKIVNIVAEDYNRYVVTFDDLTNMVVAQHKAAWSEVARRVAHEIKNPLTPIQLSAQRLHRKYVSQISNDKETFTKLIEIIVRQVGDIKRLIDEFSFFARLPEPKLKKTNLEDVCQQAVFLMNETADNIKIHFRKESDEEVYLVNGDDRLLHQCIVNIVKNAINALSTVNRENKGVWIQLRKEEDTVRLDVEDNGPGLPQDRMDSLATPYFTLLPKGTGLGLAIVKKIIQDHKGSLVFGQSAHDEGAKITMILPTFRESGTKQKGDGK